MALFNRGRRDEFRSRGLRDVRRQQLGEFVICAVAAKQFLRRRVHKRDKLLLRADHGGVAHRKQRVERVDDQSIAHFPIPPEMY